MDLQFIYPPNITTLDSFNFANSIAQVNPEVIITLGLSSNSVASIVVVLPESRKIVWFPLINCFALWAIIFLSSVFLTNRSFKKSSVPTTSTRDFAPPWIRTSCWFWSNIFKSVRKVISETVGNFSFNWEKLTCPCSLTNATISFRLCSITSIHLTSYFLMLGCL